MASNFGIVFQALRRPKCLRKSLMCLTFNQELEMIKLNEEGISKVEIR